MRLKIKIVTFALMMLFAMAACSNKAGKIASPKDLVKAINTAYEKRDGAAFYDLLSKKSIKAIEARTKMVLGYMVAQKDKLIEKFKNKIKDNNKLQNLMSNLKTLIKVNGKEFFAKLTKTLFHLAGDKLPAKIELKLLSMKIEGNKGTMQVKGKQGKEMSIPIVKENGSWKIDPSSNPLNINPFQK